MVWPWFECFPGSSIVTILNDQNLPENISISNLKISDQVLSGITNNQQQYSKVISFFHNLPNISAKFVRLYTADKTFVTLTARHLIFAKTKSADSFEFIPANTVQPGDLLQLFEHSFNKLKYVGVVKNEQIDLINSGIYAPLTESGTIIVDNIQASCFSLVKSHKLTQTFFKMLHQIHS